MPIQFINGKCHIKKQKSCRTGLTGYYTYLSCEWLLMLFGTDAHTYMHTCTYVYQLPGAQKIKGLVCLASWTCATLPKTGVSNEIVQLLIIHKFCT